jgi:hypothetical protein
MVFGVRSYPDLPNLPGQCGGDIEWNSAMRLDEAIDAEAFCKSLYVVSDYRFWGPSWLGS